MDKKQYNNVIDWTLKHETGAQSDDSLAVARAVCNNLGVALPQGDLSQVAEILATDDYMGWKSCTLQEAQEAANNGVATIGVSDDGIVVLTATGEEVPVAETVAVMTLSENVSAYAVDELQFYSYSYGTTTNPGGTTAPIDYCGGTDYKDVTKHNMLLQGDGYYVCSRCGYRVKSPELEDKDVLSLDDYLQVVSAQLLYTHYEHIIRAQYSDIADEVQVRINRLISSIRRKSEYLNKYSYSDSSGKCCGPEIVDDYPMWIGIEPLSFLDKLNYTGVFGLFNDLVIGYYAPKISLIKDITDALTGQMNALDFSAMAAGIYELDGVSTGLAVASTALDFINSNIETGDHLVKVNAGPFYGRYIYSTDGQLKMVKIVSAFA